MTGDTSATAAKGRHGREEQRDKRDTGLEGWSADKRESWDRDIPDTHRSPCIDNVALIGSGGGDCVDLRCDTCDMCPNDDVPECCRRSSLCVIGVSR